MAPTYRSEALASIHETALALYEAGSISQRTMQSFDRACLMPDPPDAEPPADGHLTDQEGEVRELGEADIKRMRPARDVLPGSLQCTMLPVSGNGAGQGDAHYEAWFRERVQQSLDDPRPSVPHEEVMAVLDARMAEIRTRPGKNAACHKRRPNKG